MDTLIQKEAGRTCQTYGATLATPKTAAAQQLLMTMSQDHGGDFWVALTNSSHDTSVYEWSDGAVATALEWAPYQPQDNGYCVRVAGEGLKISACNAQYYCACQMAP